MALVDHYDHFQGPKSESVVVGRVTGDPGDCEDYEWLAAAKIVIDQSAQQSRKITKGISRNWSGDESQPKKEPTSYSRSQSENFLLSENKVPNPGLRFSVNGETDIRRPGGATEILRKNNLLETYTILDRNLGQGHFGTVVEVMDTKSRKRYALKTVEIKDEQTGEMEAEVAISGEFDHPYIVKLHGYYQDEGYYHLIMDLCAGGDLRSFVQWVVLQRRRDEPLNDSGLPASMSAQFMYQMMAGIIYLHHYGFVHRDIKPENYLLVSDSLIKLADFGLATHYTKGQRLTSYAGTTYYMAPEVVNGSYNEKCDVWSLGVTCFAICADHLPFVGADQEEYKRSMLSNHLTVNDEGWKTHPPRHLALVLEMLVWDFEARPSVKKLLESRPWLLRYSKSDMCCSVS